MKMQLSAFLDIFRIKLLSVEVNRKGWKEHETHYATLLHVTSKFFFFWVCLNVALPPSTSVIAICSYEPTKSDWRSNSEQSGWQRDDCRRSSGGLFITLRGHQTTRPRAYLSRRRVVCAWNLFGEARGWTSSGITARHGVVTWSSCHPLHIKEALIRGATNRKGKKKHCIGFLEYQVDCYSVLLYIFLTCRGPRITL